MCKLIIDRKDDKFIISIPPYFENTLVVDYIEFSEEARNAISDQSFCLNEIGFHVCVDNKEKKRNICSQI